MPGSTFAFLKTEHWMVSDTVTGPIVKMSLNKIYAELVTHQAFLLLA